MKESHIEEATMFFGDTGSGKTTCGYLLAGHTLEYSLKESNDFAFEVQGKQEGLIGNCGRSATTVPNILLTDNGIIIDTAGFNDTNGLV